VSPAIPSSAFVSHRRYPSRLPSGSLRSAWTGPGGDAKHLLLLGGNGRLCSGTNTSGSEGTVRVTRPGFTERRILPPFVRYGLMTQSAFSVRGSSRRIMTMRFRPADIRVINRRTRLCSYHPLRAFPRTSFTRPIDNVAPY